MPEQFDAYHTWLGIPPSEQPPHHYRLLGIAPLESNPDVIEHAADRQMAHLRSLNTGKRAALTQTLLDQVAKARVCLLDAKKKAVYDRELSAKLNAGSAGVLEAVIDDENAPFNFAAGDSPFSSGSTSPSPAVIKQGKSKRPPNSSGGPSIIAAVLGLGVAIGIVAILYPIIFQALGPTADPKPNAPRSAQVAENRTTPPGSSAVKTAETSSTSPKTSTQTPVAKPLEKKPPREEQLTSADPSSGPAVDPVPSQAAPVDDKKAPPDKNAAGGTLRLAIPDESHRQQAEKLVRELFEKEIAAAKKPAERAALATALFKQADQTKDDPAGQYVLLALARENALAGGDLATDVKIMDRLAEIFEWNRLKERADDLTKLLEMANNTAAQQAIVESGLASADEAAEAEDYDLALRFARTALDAARKADDQKLIKLVTARGRELAALQKELLAFTTAKSTLQSDPADPAANLTVGRWYWFAKNDSDSALPYLAKVADAGLKSAAEKELAAPADATQRLDVADAWWDLAQVVKVDAEKNAILLHALQWYTKAAPQLTGLIKAKAEKRVAEIHSLTDKVVAKATDKSAESTSTPSTGSGSSASTASSANNPPLKKTAPGLLGEYFSGKNFDKLLGSHIDPIPNLNFAEAAGSRIPADEFSIRWTGILMIPKNGTYKFRLLSNDGSRLTIDGKVVIDCWKDVPESAGTRGGFTGGGGGGFGHGGGKGRGFGGGGGGGPGTYVPPTPPHIGEPNRGDVTLTLTKEAHPIQVEYFQDQGIKLLTVTWEQDGGFQERPIDAAALSHDLPQKKTPGSTTDK